MSVQFKDTSRKIEEEMLLPSEACIVGLTVAMNSRFIMRNIYHASVYTGLEYIVIVGLLQYLFFAPMVAAFLFLGKFLKRGTLGFYNMVPLFAWAGVWMWLSSLPLASRSSNEPLIRNAGWQIDWVSWFWDPCRTEENLTLACYDPGVTDDLHCIDHPQAKQIYKCCPPQPAKTEQDRGCIEELVYPALVRYKPYFLIFLFITLYELYSTWHRVDMSGSPRMIVQSLFEIKFYFFFAFTFIVYIINWRGKAKFCIVAVTAWCIFYIVFNIFVFLMLNGAREGIEYFLKSHKSCSAVFAEVVQLLAYEVESQLGGVCQVMLMVGRRLSTKVTSRSRVEVIALKMATLRYVFVVIIAFTSTGTFGAISKLYNMSPNCVIPKDELRYGAVVIFEIISLVVNNLRELIYLLYELVILIHAAVVIGIQASCIVEAVAESSRTVGIFWRWLYFLGNICLVFIVCFLQSLLDYQVLVDTLLGWIILTSTWAQALFTIGIFWVHGAEQLVEDLTYWRMERPPQILITSWKLQPFIAWVYIIIYIYGWVESGGVVLTDSVMRVLVENYTLNYAISIACILSICIQFAVTIFILIYSHTAKFKKAGGRSVLSATREWAPVEGASSWEFGSGRLAQFEGPQLEEHVCLGEGPGPDKDTHLSQVDTDEAEQTTSDEEYDETTAQLKDQRTVFRIVDRPNTPPV